MSASAKLVCRNLWKLYGAGAEQFLHGRERPPTQGELREAGLIGAVINADLEIRDGETFVIMGLSGSGKSTLVRCMSRLIEPTAGELTFSGVDLLRASPQELIELRRHKMGMVFQHFALLPHLTVLDNVAFPLDVQGMKRGPREDKARRVIELVGLKGREDHFPRQLSGGQQQRVGIARSLATEPELWFLDEPFSALDPLIRREMQDEFIRLRSLLKKTIIFITHDFDEAIRLADRIAIMKDGEVIQVDTPEQLLLKPANEYVANFTHHVPRDKVLSVGAVMTALAENASGVGGGAAGNAGDALQEPAPTETGQAILTSDTIAAVARQVIHAGAPLNVLDHNRNVVGTISRDQIVDILVGAP